MYINSWKVKFILIVTVILYGIMLIVFLFHNSGSKRFVSIESTKQIGVVLINKVKYKTPYLREQARIGYKTDNLADYLFLDSDTQQECYSAALLELIIVVLIAGFLWRFDFEYPFQIIYLNQSKLILGLVIFNLMLKWFANRYTSSWVGQKLNSQDMYSERYSYQFANSNYAILFIIVVVSVLLYLYSKAVKNQEEVASTV